jgi:hypothetical protein
MFIGLLRERLYSWVPKKHCMQDLSESTFLTNHRILAGEETSPSKRAQTHQRVDLIADNDDGIRQS